ncbi:16571_t:CDS:1, partial [Racocetra fulgida]
KKSKDFFSESTNAHHAKRSIRTNDEEIVVNDDEDDDEISGIPFPSHLSFSRKKSTSNHEKHKTATSSSISDFYKTEEYINDNGEGGIGDHGSPTFYNNLTEDYFHHQRSNVHSLFSSVEK